MNDFADWKRMEEADVEAAARLGDRIHLHYPEDYQVFHRRFEVYPAGMHVLRPKNDKLIGYSVFHPWTMGAPPKLNEYLYALPHRPDCLHLHDVAIDEDHRRKGYTRQFMKLFWKFALEKGYTKTTLVAVGGTETVWARFGYRQAPAEVSEAAELSYGGNAVYMVNNIQ